MKKRGRSGFAPRIGGNLASTGLDIFPQVPAGMSDKLNYTAQSVGFVGAKIRFSECDDMMKTARSRLALAEVQQPVGLLNESRAEIGHPSQMSA
jgi:hypothetical protein